MRTRVDLASIYKTLANYFFARSFFGILCQVGAVAPGGAQVGCRRSPRVAEPHGKRTAVLALPKKQARLRSQ